MIFRKSKSANSTPAPAQPAAPQADSGKARKKQKAAAGPSLLSADMVLEGNLATNGELQIDGAVHGAVQAAVCIIEANGSVQGSVVAEEVFIRGRVIGPICGVHVTVVAGGHVEGDILNQSIAIENGAYIDGKIKRSEDPMGDWQRMWYGEEEPAQLAYEADGEPPAPGEGFAGYEAAPDEAAPAPDIPPLKDKTGS